MENIDFNMEERMAQVSVSLEKLQYLVSSIIQKFEKTARAVDGQGKEAFIYERDCLRIHLDIADDYVQEAAGIVQELLADLQKE